MKATNCEAVHLHGEETTIFQKNKQKKQVTLMNVLGFLFYLYLHRSGVKNVSSSGNVKCYASYNNDNNFFVSNNDFNFHSPAMRLNKQRRRLQ